MFQRALLAVSFFIVAFNANAQVGVLNGNWYSTQWKYGYVLNDGVGVATSTNSPNFQVGQNIIQLTATSPNTFTGQQVYTDGKYYKVNATLRADGRLYFEGEKNAKWVMDRIGAPTQSSAPSKQAPQTNASASASTSTTPSFDCSKASNPYEKAVCANPILSRLDNQLATIYKNARARSADPEALRKTQVDWIKNTRQCASNTSCIEKAYKDRIVALGGGAQPQAATTVKAPAAQNNVSQAPSQQAQTTTTPSPPLSVNPNISQAQQVDLGMISGVSVRLISPVNVGGKIYYVLNTTNTNNTDESNRKTLNKLFNKGKDTNDSERVLKFEKNTIVLLNTQEISRLREALGYKLPSQWKIGNVASATKVGPNTHHNVALTSKDIFTNGGGVYGGVAIVQLNPTEPVNLADSTPKLDQRVNFTKFKKFHKRITQMDAEGEFVQGADA
jgi:uncharacterized protein